MARMDTTEPGTSFTSTFAPLRDPTFRRIWSASLLSNGGQQIQAVCAAWIMLQVTHDAGYVALVQTASMLPATLLALPGGAIADVYDRRKAAMAGLSLMLIGVLSIAALAASGAALPPLILLGCVIVGTGMAIFSPAWQASMVDILGPKSLSSGVALTSMSANLARSTGPALGGFAVIVVGAPLTLGINALLYVPMILALALWRRPVEPRIMPPESIGRATFSGVRYAAYSPPVRNVLLRSFLSACAGSIIFALLPLVARNGLNGDAGTYGVLLGMFGLGAVAASALAGALRRGTPEGTVRAYALLQGLMAILLAVSTHIVPAGIALFILGGCWTSTNAIYSVNTRMVSPRWVSGRVVASLYASVAGGLAFGSWFWGAIAVETTVRIALFGAGALFLLLPVVGIALPLFPSPEEENLSVSSQTSPDVRVDLQGRSGPIVLEIDYRIAERDSATFSALIQQLRQVRRRNGAFGVTLARDVSDPQSWCERCLYPNWHEYVRARDRPTQPERDLQAAVNALHQGPEPIRVRRMLERPAGVAREREDDGLVEEILHTNATIG